MRNTKKELGRLEIRFAEALLELLKALSDYKCEHIVEAAKFGLEREEGSVMVNSTIPFTKIYLDDLTGQAWPKSLRLVRYAFELYSEQPGCEHDDSIREVCRKAAELICLCEEHPDVYISKDIENVLGEMLRDKHEYGNIFNSRGFDPSDIPGDVERLSSILMEILDNLIMIGFRRDRKLIIDLWKKWVDEMPDEDTAESK